jgi:ABC-type glycerol-3-phosphate transport system substrate-binding protein
MDNTTFSRRDFLRMSALTAAGAALAGCAQPTPEMTPEAAEEMPEPTEPPAQAESITIVFWTFWGGFEEMLDDWKATDAYTQAFDDNNLVLELTSNVSQETFLSNIAAGTPPDVAIPGGGAKDLEYWARGITIPVGDLVTTSSLKAEDFIEANWKLCFYKGVQYGIPAMECFVRRGLAYNTRMVEEAGLDPDNPPVTWAETLEWHETLTKFDDVGNLVQIGLDPYDAEGGSFAWYHDGSFAAESWGLDWWDEGASEFNLDDELMAEAFDTMGEFVKIAGPDNLAGFRGVEGQGGWGGAFNSEVQAMIIEGYWHAGETAIQAPEVSEFVRVSWVPVPDGRRGVKLQFGGGHMLVWFKDAPNPVASFPVAEFLNTHDICDIILSKNGWLPAWKPYLESVDPSPYPGLDFYLNSVEEATEWWTGDSCEIGEFVSDQYIALRERVFRDEMTGAEAAAKFQELCETEYKAQGFG